MLRPVEGPISADFFERRPLSAPPEKRDHIHGAIDIAARVGTDIVAPEDGYLFAYIAYRPDEGRYWPKMPTIDGVPFPFGNYFYDVYGGLLVLRAEERTHIIAHCYANQIINFFTAERISYYEQKEALRFPLHALYSERIPVFTGERIGFVGNAGYSTGPHIHWEIHPGYRWFSHEKRSNPEELIK